MLFSVPSMITFAIIRTYQWRVHILPVLAKNIPVLAKNIPVLAKNMPILLKICQSFKN
jgi:hypothetical protein